MNPRTPAQLNAIRTWTEERDALRAEIGTLSIDRDELAKSNVESADALTDKNLQISEARGRIAELVALEERTRTSLPIDIAELEARKSRLQSECTTLEAQISGDRKMYGFIVEATEVVRQDIDAMRDQSQIVKSVTSDIIEESKKHLSDTKEKASEIKAVFNTVIDRANENLAQTKVVIEKMPKMIFDMQRPIPVRRTYPVGHPNAPVIES